MEGNMLLAEYYCLQKMLAVLGSGKFLHCISAVPTCCAASVKVNVFFSPPARNKAREYVQFRSWPSAGT
jgi:hypothetical protein